MKILVCVKRVPMTGGRIVLSADGRAIDTRHLGFTISPHEECGLEEAVRLVEHEGGEVVVLSLGPAEAEEQLRDAMAVGADRALLLEADPAAFDAQAAAAAILDAIAADGDGFDLIVFGNESADAANFQVGIRVAHALRRPVASGVKGLSLDGALLRCEVEVAGGRDLVELALPAVVTVKEGLNLPRYPSVPGRLRARSKPLVRLRPLARAPRLELVALELPPDQGKQARVLGHGAEAAAAVVELIAGLGLA